MKQFLALLAALVVLGLIMEYWKLLLGLLVLCAIVAAALPLAIMGWDAGVRAYKARQDRAEAARMEVGRLAARASLQHGFYLDGDRRGIYGEFPPVDLDKI